MTSNPALEAAIRRALGRFIIAFGDKLDGSIDEVLETYVMAVTDLEPLDIDGAVPRIVRSERFFPRPAVLRSNALEERTARTVMVRPLIHTGEDIQCSLCGSTRIWYRTVTNDRGEFQRCEVEHRWECPVKRADQPALILTKGAA